MQTPKTPPPDPRWGQGPIVSAVRAALADTIVGKIGRPNFETIAAALRRQANDLVLAAHGAEQLGARLSMTLVDVEHRVKELRSEAVLVGEAYYVIANLSPLEQSIRAMIEA